MFPPEDDAGEEERPETAALSMPECGMERRVCEYRRSEHLDQLDIEDEGGARRNDVACAAFAVCEIRRNEQAVFGAFIHELKRLGSAGDDLRQHEFGRLPALDGAVEYGAVEELARVMHADLPVF